MAGFVRSAGAFIGTSETSGVTIATTATQTGGQVDVLGDDTSGGYINLFLAFTSTVTAGTLDVTVNNIRVTGQVYAAVSAQRSYAPTNGTQIIPMGRFPLSRYMSVNVKNNATGASATNVFVGYELFKVS